jgi:hypothetical protein
MERWRSLNTAFPDQREEIVGLVEGSDCVAFEPHIVETHTGELVLPFATIPPTGLSVDEILACFAPSTETVEPSASRITTMDPLC